jgi:hypothetical protein
MSLDLAVDWQMLFMTTVDINHDAGRPCSTLGYISWEDQTGAINSWIPQPVVRASMLPKDPKVLGACEFPHASVLPGPGYSRGVQAEDA